jgi:hypothetical protein
MALDLLAGAEIAPVSLRRHWKPSRVNAVQIPLGRVRPR